MLLRNAFFIHVLLSGSTALSLAACGDGDETPQDTAPAHLVENGAYDDARFIDMMAPHHAMAVEAAQLAVERASHPELRMMAEMMVVAQQREIDELEAAKQRLFGTAGVPAQMNPEEMENSGAMTADELAAAPDFDKAFIDSMIPHHAGAIRMGSVAMRRTSDAELRAMARKMVTDQSKEIGQMIEWREEWYGANTP